MNANSPDPPYSDDDKTVGDRAANDKKRSAKTVFDSGRTIDQPTQPPASDAPTHLPNLADQPETRLDENGTIDHEPPGETRDAEVISNPPDHDSARTIDSHAERPSFLPPDQRSASINPTTPSVTTPEAAGRGPITSLPEHIGRYETIDRLGEGSFGVVLKARDPNLDREVAIKLQKVNPLRSKKNLERFRIEAKAAASLRHPHIVPVYEFGEFGGNQFIVYEYIQGQTLDAWMEHEKPDLKTRANMFVQICEALDYAHSLGIIHRDIKPANILIADEEHQPHIADFGCAKVEHAETNQTVDGTMLGTPPYMSPEVIEGFASVADARSDIWSLGVMLYEALVGERPFRGNINQLRDKIARLNPKRPSHLDPGLPIDLETITLKCLEKEPARRYQRCQEIADDLRNWINGRPIAARRVGPIQKTWMWAKRNPATASMLSAIAVCLMALAVGSVLYSVNMARQRDAIVQRRIAALYTASPDLLPELVEDLKELNRPQAMEQLRLIRQRPDRDRRERFVDSLTSTAFSDSKDDLANLIEQVPTCEPAELRAMLYVASDALLQDGLAALQTMAGDDQQSSLSRSQFSARCLLANLKPDDPSWKAQCDQLVGFLLAAERNDLVNWCQLLKPIRESMQDAWSERFHSDNASVAQRAAEIVSILYELDPLLCELGLDASPKQLAAMQRALKNSHVAALSPESPGQRANFCFMLAHVGNINAWRQFVVEYNNHPTRSYLIRDSGPANLAPKQFIKLLRKRLEGADGSIDWSNSANQFAFAADSGDEVSAYVLALGHFNQQQLYQTQRRELVPLILRYLKQHRSVAVHAACRWLLERWGFGDEADQFIQQNLRTEQPLPGFQWHEDVTGICFAVFDPVDNFSVGPPPGYEGPTHADMNSGDVDIPRRFGIAIHETTVGAIAEWEKRMLEKWQEVAESDDANAAKWPERIKNYKGRQLDRKHAADTSAPMTNMTWHAIALYCNGLNRASGMTEADDVYKVTFGKRSFQANSNDDGLTRMGYRLPTQNEWEFAARAGGQNRFFFGADLELLNAYAWSVGNSQGSLQPVGKLMPNSFGMFDIIGNAAEWCHDLPPGMNGVGMPRMIRGQSCSEQANDMTVYWPKRTLPSSGGRSIGFRVARTYEPTQESN